MLRSNLTLIFRQLRNIYALLNLTGLVIGFSAFTLIFIWVNEEVSYDRFQPDYEKIYRVVGEQSNDQGEILPMATTPAPLAEYLGTNFPEIESTCKLMPTEFFIKYGEAGLYKEGLSADPSFFNLFSFPIKKGSLKDFSEGTDKIIISQRMAQIYFAEEDPIGKVFLIAGHDVMVIAVMENVPPNSHLQFDFVLPIKFLEEAGLYRLDLWDYLLTHTYIKTRTAESQSQLEAKIKNVAINKSPEATTLLKLQPLADIHLKSNHLNNDMKGQGNYQYVYLFSIIATFILIIVGINYSNLATSRSTKRSRETGVRKVMGASRQQLATFFFSESILYCIVALGISFIISWILLPYFNELSGKQLEFHLLSPKIIGSLFSCALLCALLGGAYPALLLSSQNPVAIFKGYAKTGNKAIILRRFLLVVQFIVTISLLTGTLFIQRQLGYINSKELGYEKENIISFTALRKIRAQYSTFKNELLKSPSVKYVTANNTSISFSDAWTDEVLWEGKNPNSKIIFHQLIVDHDYLKTYSISLLSGRDFSESIASDSSGIILNEVAVLQMGLTDPVNKVIKLSNISYTIIGVVKNFHFKSIHKKVEPLLIYIDPSAFYQISVKLQQGNLPDQVSAVETIFKKFAPERPFDYTFLDGDIQKLYLMENRTGKIFQYFSILSIFVSCLGLFGIILFVTEQRAKELAIRKVMGASVYKLMFILSLEYFLMVLIAFCIAAPIMYYAVDKWLDNFSYRIETDVRIFLTAGLICLVFTWLTVAWRSYKAANSNPVESLRSE